MFSGVGRRLGAEQPSSVTSVSGDSVCCLLFFRSKDEPLFPMLLTLVNDAFESTFLAQGWLIDAGVSA